MEFFKNVVKKSTIIVIAVAGVSAFFEWRKLPLGILTGWALGILNLRGLVKNVEGFVGIEQATIKLLISSMVRLLILCGVIFMLVWFNYRHYEIISIPGMIFGFTTVFVLILVEGMKAGKREQQ